jgi:hypothetical protein
MPGMPKIPDILFEKVVPVFPIVPKIPFEGSGFPISALFIRIKIYAHVHERTQNV